MFQVVKRAAHWLAPSLYVALRYWWNDWRRLRDGRLRKPLFSYWWEDRQRRGREKRFQKVFYSNDQAVVKAGPYAGMVYFTQAVGSALFAKIIGSYEEELIPVVERIIANQPTRVIDIGCAEGYYAVGFARRLPAAQIYAFDIDRLARTLCRRTAKANGVDARVSVDGECTFDRLKELVTAETTILSDCEGCELDLLDPQRVPGLASATLLVELHDLPQRPASLIIPKRFAATHDVMIIDSRERDPSHYPVLQPLRRGDQIVAIDETRPVAMQWAFMEPKRRNSMGG